MPRKPDPKRWPMTRAAWDKKHPRNKRGRFKVRKRVERLAMFPKIRR